MNKLILALSVILAVILVMVFSERSPSRSPSLAKSVDVQTPETAAPAQPQPVSVPPAAATVKPRSIGEAFRIGYWSYTVNRAGFVPDMGLVLQITAENNDKESSTLPPFYLVDTEGRKYSRSSAGMMSEGFFGPLETFNPDIPRAGYVAFEVPQTRWYSLLVSGGFTSGKTQIVQLERDPPPAH